MKTINGWKTYEIMTAAYHKYAINTCTCTNVHVHLYMYHNELVYYNTRRNKYRSI